MKRAFMRILDEIPEMIYLADMDTYEFLYANKALRKVLSERNAPLEGTCHKVLHNLDAPCPFCNNRRLSEASSMTWRHYNRRLGRQFQISDTTVNLDGRRVRMEIATDITATLAQEELVAACVRVLYASEDGAGLPQVLGMVGGFLGADRVYVVELPDAEPDISCEWCRSGLEPGGAILKHLPRETLLRWLQETAATPSADLEPMTLEGIRAASAEDAAALDALNPRSLLVAPFRQQENGGPAGFLCVDNYKADFLDEASLVLQSLEYFVASSLRLRDSVKRLRHMSFYDQLTGLRNRNGFTHDARAGARDVGIAFLDVNGLKEINGSEGHMRGDILLQHTSSLLREIYPNARCYRMGGDEFAVVWDGITEEEFGRRLERLRGAFSGICGFSASVGGHWCEEGSLMDMLEQADMRMSDSKRSFYRRHPVGRRYRHGNDFVVELSRPGRMEELIRDEAFMTYWQPKYSAATGRMTGAEALVRLRNGDKLVPPDLFIPALEVTRLIPMVDFHVFEMTCRQQRRWLDEGLDVLPVSTNFSSYTMEEPDFVDRLDDIRRRHDIPFSLAEVEITERVDATDRDQFSRIATALKERGFRIAIDDFGVQHANIRLLMDIDSDILKLDKCLLHRLLDSRKVSEVLRSVFSMCRRLGISTVVEGVETTDELDVLRRLECDEIQGYIFSRPLPVDQFETLFRNSLTEH